MEKERARVRKRQKEGARCRNTEIERGGEGNRKIKDGTDR